MVVSVAVHFLDEVSVGNKLCACCICRGHGGGFGAITPSGGLDPGLFSVNGQRESANGFILNGANVEESIANGAAVIPNLDSIAEFRVLTSNFDAVR